MSVVLAKALLEKLNLEAIDLDLFRAQNEEAFGGRLFGGQVLAQALAAAQKTLYDHRPCHSLHGYFLRPGRLDTPVVFQVERIRDGRSFTTRRVIAVQRGQAIFSLDASFQLPERGLNHQVQMGSYPSPDQLEDDQAVAARLDLEEPRKTWMTRPKPFQTRSVSPLDLPPVNRTEQAVWIRFSSTISSPDQQQQLLAYASDMGLVSTSALPHREHLSRDHFQMASLDHTLWFHDDFDVSEWVLYVKDTPVTGGNRGLNRGTFFDDEGRCIASVIQEGLMRVADTNHQG
ncbi:MAG: acyl-CoA thioesterase [Pseudomonadales bacterium]